MGAKWLRLEADIVDHPKTGRLETLLGTPLAGWYVVRALSWLSRFCPTGQVRDIDGASLESSCQWRGESGRLLDSLVKAGWLDVLANGGWEWHDWAEHQGKVASKAAKERARKAAYRARLAAERAVVVPPVSHGTEQGHPGIRDVTGRDVTGRSLTTAGSAEEPPLEAAATPPPPADPPPTPAPKKTAKPADPTWKPFVAELAADFEELRGSKVVFDLTDMATLKRLRKSNPDIEIRARWRRGLVGKYDRKISSLTQLGSSQKWNALAADEPGGDGALASNPGGWSEEDQEGPLRAEIGSLR